jgi:hypothetical protein
MVFPPPLSGRLSRREMRPCTVTGKSVWIDPFTVPVSSWAAKLSGTASRTDPFCVSASSPDPSQPVPASITLSEPFWVRAWTSPPTSVSATEPLVVRRSSRPDTPSTPSAPLVASRERSNLRGTHTT